MLTPIPLTPRLRLALRSGFVLALALTLFFAVRLTLGALYWQHHRDQPIEGWMAAGYVARSWDVPREVISQALGLPPDAVLRPSVERFAQREGVPTAALIDRLAAAIAAYRETAHE